MARQERQKRSTVSNQVAAIAELSEGIQPPFPLSEAELEVFHGLIASRERSTWNAHDLRQAAKCARLEIQYEEEYAIYVAEGTVLANERGTPVENPRGRACGTIHNKIKSITTQLGLSASQRGISGEKQAKRNEFETKQHAVKKSQFLA